ncbi:hypothetical protein HB671_25165 [Bacillus cereus]|nr:hypothetical protein [Bacillus cereus]
MYNKRKASCEMGREKLMSSQQLVNLRIDFAFKQLFGTSGNQDSSFRQAYEAREKALMDEAAKFVHARNEGKKEGIEEGKIQLIRGMHKNGMPIEDIAKFTNLHLEEIESILQV